MEPYYDMTVAELRDWFAKMESEEAEPMVNDRIITFKFDAEAGKFRVKLRDTETLMDGLFLKELLKIIVEDRGYDERSGEACVISMLAHAQEDWEWAVL